MVPDPHPAAIGLNRGKDVKSSLEPGCEPMGNFQGLVLGMIRGKYAVDDALGTLHREVAVNLHHRVASGHQIGTVNLDFGVVLGVGCDRRQGKSGCGGQAK